MKGSGVWTTLAGVLCLVVAGTCGSSLLFRREWSLRSRQSEAPPPKDTKTWLFAVDGIKRPYSFVDADGSLVGFDVDVISAVCSLAGKKCSMVLAEFTECTFTHRNMNFPGRGLMAGWFDACPGYAITLDRQASFAFTDPYITTVATFTVAPDNPAQFDPTSSNYTGFTLTHLTGAPTNAACLNRLHKTFGDIVIAKDLPEAKALLLNKTVQALFSPRTRIPGLDVLGARFHCDEGGAGVMVRKGSPLPLWWNPAFKQFYESGDYQTLCENDSQKYNYPIKCLAPPP